MRLIGTAVAIAAALMLVTAGVADAKGKKRGHRGPAAYKFTVECPVMSPMPWTRGTCSAKGKNIEAARATCQTQNQFCYIRNVSKAKAKGKRHK